MLRKLSLAAALSVAAAVAPSAARSDAAAPRAVTVEIRDMKYVPENLTVAAGTTVTWVNKDQAPHTVTDRSRGFASAALDTGERYSYTFTKPGEFAYFCALHPFMTARVAVK
jgi:plastocyanin